MKVGVYFTPNKSQGGVHQYSVAFLEALSSIPKNEYAVISTSKDIPSKFLKSKRFKIVDISARREFALRIRDFFSNCLAVIFPRLMGILFRAGFFRLLTPINKLLQSGPIKIIEDEKLDLVFYPTTSNLSFLTDIPAAVSVLDLQHRLNPEFKEVSAGGRWEFREYGFINISRKAFRIFVDSEIGKRDMIRFYHTDPKKVVPLPYLPPSYLNPKISDRKTGQIKQKLSLPDNYIFYPAKFWPHKNHKNIILALSYLKTKGRKINVVFTGPKNADFSSFEETMKLVAEKELKEQVLYLGYVSNEELSAIYKLAKAMVMPTFFGTSHIPVLEAWLMGTPVIYSDIRGCREQLGDAGLLVNPNNPRDIGNKIWQLYTNSNLRKDLIAKGRKRVKRWTMDDFIKSIGRVIKDMKLRKSSDKIFTHDTRESAKV